MYRPLVVRFGAASPVRADTRAWAAARRADRLAARAHRLRSPGELPTELRAALRQRDLQPARLQEASAPAPSRQPLTRQSSMEQAQVAPIALLQSQAGERRSRQSSFQDSPTSRFQLQPGTA